MFTVITGIIVSGMLIVAVVLLANRSVLVAIDAEVPDSFRSGGFQHESFESLLKKYVDSGGLVNYDGWHESSADRQELDRYLAAVAVYSPDATPDRFSKQSQKLAYWLYAYNAYVIKSILLNWPLQSVTDVKAPVEAVKGLGFFYRQKFMFGGAAYSLYAVENDIIRKQYRDPRIHFVLNCASASCPVMKPELPDGDDLEMLMREATIEFVSDSRNVRVDHDKRQVVVSTIFKWYEKDFLNELRRQGRPAERGVMDYIAGVGRQSLRSELEKAKTYDLIYADYDWTLNKQP